MGPRLVVFTGDLGYAVRAGIAAIDAALPGASWLVLVHAPRKSAVTLLRSQWRQLKRERWRWLPAFASELCRRMFPPRAGRIPDDAPGLEATLSSIEREGRLRVVRCDDIHAASSVQLVASFVPDLGLSLAAPILRPPLFSLPRLGTLNLHKGRVPDYRGMPPAFWELWNGEQEIGCTVHRVDAGLDSGDIVAQSAVRRERHSTLKGLQLTLDRAGIELMRDAVAGTLHGTLPPRSQPAGGRTYRKPTLAQQAELERRLCRAGAQTSGRARAFAKDVALAGLCAAWTVLRFVASPRIVVLLYHRVSDDVRDNLTVGVEQFERQMALLRARCDVLSIDEVAAMRDVPRTRRPLVCVTFDDGYLDNYVHAAPILQRHRVPAAFFVATRIVGSTRPFPHDVRRGNDVVPVMSWQQLREMVRAGFTIGSHSATHIDCASEPEDVVERELRESLDDLRRELGLREAMFAYPYGGRQNMTPARLELVKQAGYTACLSAYGGTNLRSVDRYDIRRGGIHWGFSDRAFLARCLGLV